MSGNKAVNRKWEGGKAGDEGGEGGMKGSREN